MNALNAQTISLLEMLPDEEQSLVNTLVKKLVKSWDPDFSKLTPQEKSLIDEAEKEVLSGDYYSEDEVWK